MSETEEVKISKLIGTEKRSFKLAGGKEITLYPAKLKVLSRFQEQFGRERMFLSNKHKDENQLELDELIFLLWELQKPTERPWASTEEMEEDLLSCDLMDVAETIYSFFHGATIGDGTSFVS